MICPVCHNKVKMKTHGIIRVFIPHQHSEIVLYCPASNRSAEEAYEIAKMENAQ